jgi:Ferric reductase NAD binding domain
MFSEQLSSVCLEFQTLQEQMRGLKLEVTVYVTCDESFTEEHKSLISNVTAPKTSFAVKSQAVEHGVVEVRSRTSGEKQGTKTLDEVMELTTISSHASDEGANTCCCRTTVDEASTSNPKPCSCCTPANGAHRSSSRTSTSITPLIRKQGLLVHPSIQIFSGRPQPKDIIRRSLEQALGESAVVVCGPQGLISDVKQGVVELSDERAVHKGTGAQGVYLHTEGFGY